MAHGLQHVGCIRYVSYIAYTARRIQQPMETRLKDSHPPISLLWALGLVAFAACGGGTEFELPALRCKAGLCEDAPTQQLSTVHQRIQYDEPRLAELQTHYQRNAFRLHPQTTPGVFDVLVAIDTNSFRIQRDELDKVLVWAEKMLFDVTGIHMHYLDVVEVALTSAANCSPGQRGSCYGTGEFLADHLAATPDNAHPEGFIIFRNNRYSFTYGAHASAFRATPAGYCNEFSQPSGATRSIHGGIIAWHHPPGGCGYQADPQTLTRQHVSDVSFDGQCINQPGTPCVYNEVAEMFLCQNLIDHPNPVQRLPSLEPLYLTAKTIVHELMHQFHTPGTHAAHAQSPDCTQLLDGTPGLILAGFHQLERRFGFYDAYGICEDTYYNFVRGSGACRNGH